MSDQQRYSMCWTWREKLKYRLFGTLDGVRTWAAVVALFNLFVISFVMYALFHFLIKYW